MISFLKISQAVQDGDENEVIKLVEEGLKNGMVSSDILEKGLISGVQAIGERFKSGELYLPEILISVRAMNYGLEIIKPYLINTNLHKKGKVIIGTVEGDLHDIGKNLVGMMLNGNGFEVIDLGVDVPPFVFVSAIHEHKPDIVALSGLLTTTIINFPNVIDAIKEAGLRNTVKVMIGGAPVTREYADTIGAEGFAENCASAVDEVKLT